MPRKNIYYYLNFGIYTLTAAGAIASFLAMAGLFVAGLFEIVSGTYFFLLDVAGQETHLVYADLIGKIIRGIELVLIAPIAFLLFKSLASYLPDTQDDTGKSPYSELLRVKALLGSLFVALVATNVVGATLRGPLDLTQAIASAILIVVLGLYFFALDHLAGKP